MMVEALKAIGGGFVLFATIGALWFLLFVVHGVIHG